MLARWGIGRRLPIRFTMSVQAPTGARGEIRRYLGWALVGALTVAALTGCAALLSGSFDDTDWRMIATSLGFALCSSAAASGELLRKRSGPGKQVLGGATVVSAVATFLLLTGLVWIDDDSDRLVRALGVLALTTLCASHASLMIAGRRPGDSDTVSALTTASIVLGSVEGLLGASAIVDVAEADEGYAQLSGVLVIALLLTTVLAPLIRKLGTPASGTPLADTPRSPSTRASGVSDHLPTEVQAIAERIELLNADPARRSPEIRAECRRLRDLARTHGR